MIKVCVFFNAETSKEGVDVCQVEIGKVHLDVPEDLWTLASAKVDGTAIVIWLSLKKGHTYEELKEKGFSCKVIEDEKKLSELARRETGR